MRVGLMNGIGSGPYHNPFVVVFSSPYGRERGRACVYPRTHNHPLLTDPSASIASGLARGVRGGASDR